MSVAPSTPRRILFPLVILTPFPLFLLLLLLGLSDDLDRSLAATPQDLPPAAFSPDLRRTVRGFHAHSPLPDLTRPLAAALVPSGSRGLHAAVRRFAFTLLIALKYNGENLLITYLNRIPLGSADRVRVAGFPQAAAVYFGVSYTRLTAGETALLCDLALHPRKGTPLTHPEDTLKKRESILQRLRNAGTLSQSEFLTESELPLSLAPDHRPIW